MSETEGTSRGVVDGVRAWLLHGKPLHYNDSCY